MIQASVQTAAEVTAGRDIDGIMGGGRSFGVKGEGYASADFTGSRSSDKMKEPRYGLRIPSGDADTCADGNTAAYSKYVVIPKRALP